MCHSSASAQRRHRAPTNAARLLEQGEALRNSMIEPVLVRIVGSTFEHGLTAELSNHTAYAVAHNDGRWLSFCPTRLHNPTR